MDKGIISKLALSTILLISPIVNANDLDIDAIKLDIPKPANTSGKKGVIANIKGHKGSSFDAEQFNRAFREGASSANDVGLPLANGRELKTLAGYQQTSVPGAKGAWQFSIHGWDEDLGPDTSGNISIYQAPGMMANYGNRYEYVFYFPEAPLRFVDRIEAALEKSKKSFSKVEKGVVVTFPRTEAGQLYVHAAFEYDAKTSTGKLKSHVSSLLLESRSMFNRYLSESRHAERKYLKELSKSKPANLGKAEFYQLLTDLSGFDASKYDEPHADTNEGFAFVSWNKIDYMIWNFKDKFVVGAAQYDDKNLSEAQIQKLNDAWLNWGKSKIGKKATSVEIRKESSKGHPISVLSLTYPLDGTLTGKDIEKLYMDFLEDGLPKADKEYNKIKKKL